MNPRSETCHLRAVCATAFAALCAWGCGTPEAFHNGADSGPGRGPDVPPISSGGTMGSGGSGSGGMIAAGGRGTGGMGSGGMMGTAGAGSGGRGTGGSGTGGAATGGRGTGGAGTGGRGTGGMGTGGQGTGGAATGGRGTGGVGTGGASTGGRGTGGSATGGSGTGGAATGGRGTGGAGTGGSTGTNPCAGLCASPIVFTTATYQATLGTIATCHETVASPQGGNCGNFVAPRSFSVNGAVQTICTTGGNWPSLPAKRNGGYCFQSTMGDHSYAYFGTF